MSIHKARFKRIEELPEEEKCCQERIEHFKTIAGISIYTVDTSITTTSDVVECKLCKRKIILGAEVWATNEKGSGFIPVNCLDIDEAPCPPSN